MPNARTLVPGFLILLLFLLQIVAGPVHAQGADGQGTGDPVHEVETLDFGLPSLPGEPPLETPQAALEFFWLNAEAGDYAAAAHALDLRQVPDPDAPGVAPLLARKLHHIIRRKLFIDWSSVSAYPDGRVQISGEGGGDLSDARSMSILGRIDMEGVAVPVSLQRLKPPNGDPVWLFSASTVSHIDRLWDIYPPGLLERHLPEQVRKWSPGGTHPLEWGVLLVLAVLSWMLAALVARLLLMTLSLKRGQLSTMLSDSLGAPVKLILTLLFLLVSSERLLGLSGLVTSYFSLLLSISIGLASVWLIARLMDTLSAWASWRYTSRMKDPDAEASRRVRTQLSVARRLFLAVVVGGGMLALFSQVDLSSATGASILASAGVLTVIIGIAARPILGNLIAGLQIGATQPIRIADYVVFEGHWGTVEDISFTHVVLHTWDRRRLMIPHTYLLSKPLENMSKHDRSVTWPVYLKVDYACDIDSLRRRYEELLEADERWDRYENRMEVMEMADDGLEVRALASGRDAVDTWYLSVHIREELVKFLQAEQGGRYLRRLRHIVDYRSDGGGTRPQCGDAKPESGETSDGSSETGDGSR